MEPDKRLEKARMLLMSKPNTTFFVSLAYNLPAIVSTALPTAGTNGKRILFNPNFMEVLNDEELLFLYLHEIMHVVLQHVGRNKDHYDRKLWNVAGDYVINLFLHKNGFQMPKDALLDQRYENMTTEEVYITLVDENSQEMPDHNDLMPEDSDLGDSDGDGNQEEEEGSSGGNNGVSSGSDQNSIQGEAQTLKISLGKSTEDMLKEAVTASRMSDDLPGHMPGELERKIKTLFSTQVPWQTLFNKALGGTTIRKTTWLRPKPKYLPTYLPKVKKEGIDTLLIAVDASGSVTKEELSTYLAEVYYLLQVSKPRQIKFIAFDTDIRFEAKIKNIQQLRNICRKGFPDGGGTSIIPVMEYIQDNPTEVAVVFSDGMFYTPSELLYKRGTRYIWLLTDLDNSYADMGMDNNQLKGEKIYIRTGG